MKRKKLTALGLALLLIVTLLGGCGASSEGETAAAQGNFGPVTENAMTDAATSESAPEEDMGETPAVDAQQSAKLIYRGNLEMETTAFDDAAADLQELVKSCGGYVESSSLHNYGSGYRSADYVVRVPAEKYHTFFADAGALCHVTWKSEETENVSRQYYDTAGRLTTQETKLARLQELLAQAENMEDIITIESAISETEYQIESLSGELRNYDDLVDYSTVTINLREVYKLSNTEEPATGFGSRLGTAFSSGMKNFMSGLEDLLVALAYHWVLVIVAAVVIVLVVRHVRKKRENAPPAPPKPKIHIGKKNDSETPKE